MPVFEMHIPLAIGLRLLNRTPAAWNTPLQLDLWSEGKAPGLDRRIAADLLELHRGLGLDVIRCPSSAETPRSVRKINDETWLLNGVRYSWLSGSLWRREWPNVKPETVAEENRAGTDETREGLMENLSVLRRLKSLASDEFFLTYDADGSWGPVVSNPPLLQNVLQWMYTQPSLVEDMLDSFTSAAVRLGEAALDEGADAILMCVDYGHSGGPWMRPDHFKRFVKPRLKRQCEAFRRRGGFTVLHSDGNIAPVLADVVDAGIDAYQGIDVHAGMDLQSVKELYGSRIALIGNVSPHVLEFGSGLDVEREVARCLNAAAPGGGYILSASANISIGTNLRNFRTMLERARRSGSYPAGTS
ncbi:MAG: uroporphyrinogen decarboxylase family protein [Candidatus Bathyarchaeia archaeon]